MAAYSQNFDGLASGALISTLAGWDNGVGTSLAATTAQSNSSPNGITVSVSGDSACYVGLGPLTDQEVTAAVYVQSGARARLQVRADTAGANWYEVRFAAGSNAFSLSKRTAGVDGTAITMTGLSAGVINPNTWYWVKLGVSGSNPAVIQAKRWPIGSAEPAYEGTYTDSTAPFTSGYPGVRLEGGGAAPISYADDFTASGTTAALIAQGVSFSGVNSTTVTVTTPSATGGTPPLSYQFQRAPDVSGSPGTFANIGTAGSALSYVDTGLTLGVKYWYRVAVTDGASATSTGASSSVTTFSAPLAAGVASLSANANGALTVTSTPATGGASAISQQWYRSTDPTLLGSAISGATTLTFTDTGLVNGTPYYYTLQYTDGTTTVISQASGVPAAPVYLGVIGDSWTNAVTPTVGSIVEPSPAGAGFLVGPLLESLFTDGTQVILSNKGIGGTNGSVWQPGGSNLTAALAAFSALHSNMADWNVLVHLGINDSSVQLSTPPGGESLAQYTTYIQGLVAHLVNTAGVGKVILIGPPNINPVSANHTVVGQKLLSQYFSGLQSVAAEFPGRVFASNSEYVLTTNNQNLLGSDHVHPTPPDANGQGGSPSVATVWANAVYAAVRPASAAVAQAQIFYRLGL